ncbi:MAG: hypothetical protein RML32_11100 [Gammaproteobacteria bacterium]|nr:hypothetical protein [Gammaproteobacteria bacterium]
MEITKLEVDRRQFDWQARLLVGAHAYQIVEATYDVVLGHALARSCIDWQAIELGEFLAAAAVLCPRILENVTGLSPIENIDKHARALFAQLTAQIGPKPEPGTYDIAFLPMGSDLPAGYVFQARHDSSVVTHPCHVPALFAYWFTVDLGDRWDQPLADVRREFRRAFAAEFDLSHQELAAMVREQVQAVKNVFEALTRRIPKRTEAASDVENSR